jgi:hypothetical protein
LITAMQTITITKMTNFRVSEIIYKPYRVIKQHVFLAIPPDFLAVSALRTQEF